MSTISSRVGGCPRASRSLGGDQDPGRAEAALERVVPRNASCSGVSSPVAGEPLDRHDLAAVGLHGEQQARADGDAVEPDRARAADAVLAADVRPGQAERVPQEVGEEQPRLDLLAIAPAVDGDVDRDHAARSRRARPRGRRARGRAGAGTSGRWRASASPTARPARLPTRPGSLAGRPRARVGRSMTEPSDDAQPVRVTARRPRPCRARSRRARCASSSNA